MKFKNISESDYIKLFDLIQKKDKSLKIFLFTGQVGSGKTTMIKSFTKKLSVNNNTSSPTFNIINEYKDDNKKSIYHLDLYRLKSINDLVEEVIHDKIRLDEDKKAINNSDGTIEVEDIINADSEYSHWRDRDRMWMSRNRESK